MDAANKFIGEFKLPNLTVSCSFGGGDDEKLAFVVTGEEIAAGHLIDRLAAGVELLRRAVAVRLLPKAIP